MRPPTRRCSIGSKPSKGFSRDWRTQMLAAPSRRGRCSRGCAASMPYRVEMARRAESDLEELYLWVVDRAPQQGARWFNGLERAILSLDHHPKRCPVAPASVDPAPPVRVLSFGRKPHWYRIFFTVDDDAEIVRVLHVRRGARRRPMAGELRGV